MNVVAKFKCIQAGGEDGNSSFSFVPVSSSDPESENGKFFNATPAGSLSLSSTKLALATFEIGKEYLLELSPAE